MSLKSRILAVDDDLVNISILEELLGDDYQVLTAGSGEEAIAKAEEFRPDLLLLDIMMPGMDGYETCRRLRANKDLCFCKIILVSAKAMVSERLKGYDAGADDYVTKPFDHTELLAKVKVFLRMKSMEEVEQQRSHFITLLHHETRTPLTYIQGAAECLAAAGEIPPEERMRMAKLIVGGTGRLQTLLEEATLFFKLKAGYVDTNSRLIDLDALTRRILVAKSTKAERKQVTLSNRPDGGPGILVNEELVGAMLTGLIDKLIGTTRAGGAISIAASEGTNWTEIRVTARGTQPEYFERAIAAEPFEIQDLDHHADQIDLEVPLMRELARICGGELQVEGIGQDGVVLKVLLPPMERPDAMAA